MWTHRLAVATTVVTFILLIAGGLVHGTGASLACPDWPTCYGTFMPPMEGLIFFEHGHRLIATFTGMLTIGVLVTAWNSPHRKLAAWLLAIVIFQGVLGGITVIFKLPPAVSTSHLATSMIFFSLLSVMAFRTRSARPPPEAPEAIRRLILAAGAAVYVQIVLGAVVRHTNAGLACMGFPLCGESGWPSGAIFVHMTHRTGALIVTVLTSLTMAKIIRSSATADPLRKLAKVTLMVLAAQVTLGILSVFTHLELITVTAHLAVGALLLVCHVSLWMLARGPEAAVVPAPIGPLPQGVEPSPAN